MESIRKKYEKEVIPEMKKKFGYSSIMAVPRIEKIVVNCGVGRLRDEKDRMEVQKYLTLITGQKPSPRPARIAIAAFKTRQGLIIGYQVTLRGKRMYDFLARFIGITLPRVRDFQGIGEKSFDGKGNLTVGVKEHIVFPEMIGEDYKILFGFEVTIVTTAKRREEGIELLRQIGMPLKRE